jgi:heat shock protein HslJ
MKKVLFYLSLPVVFLFASCTADDDYQAPDSVTEIVTKGKWKVDIYMDANMDQTNDFAGYSFTFSGNGGLTATANGNTYTGSWTEDAANRKVTINFANANPVLERINNQWTISELNYMLINLVNNTPQSEFLGIAQQ